MICSLSFVSVFVCVASLVLEPPKGRPPPCGTYSSPSKDVVGAFAEKRNPYAVKCCSRTDCQWSELTVAVLAHFGGSTIDPGTCSDRRSDIANNCYEGSVSESADRAASRAARAASRAASKPKPQPQPVLPAATTIIVPAPRRHVWWDVFEKGYAEHAAVLKPLMDLENKVILTLVEMGRGRPTKTDYVDRKSITALCDDGVLVQCKQNGPRILAAKTLFRFLRAKEVKVTVFVQPIFRSDTKEKLDVSYQTGLGERRVELAVKVMGGDINIQHTAIDAHDDAHGKRGFELSWASDQFSTT